MKHNLIKTDNYLLVVDDSEIKEGNIVYVDCSEIEVRDIRKVKEKVKDYYNEKFLFDGGGKIHIIYSKKIIAHLPLNGAPVLEDVPLLPSLPKEDDVEKLAEEYVSTNYPHYIDQKEKAAAIEDVCWGYKKAKKMYKYTEQDVRAIKRILIYDDDKNDAEKITEVIRVIESLQQPKLPIAFECEMEVGDYGDKDGLRKFVKTITNSQGRTEWVGKYV